MSIHLKGAGGAPGIVLGRAVLYLPAKADTALAYSSVEDALAHLAAAQASAAQSLSALAERLRGEGREEEAGIFDAQAMLVEDQFLSDEVARRMRDQGEPLSGARPNYRLYRASDGWIALAALETHFLARITQALELQSFDAAVLEARFAEHSCAHWERIAAEHDLPLATVQ